MASPHCGRGYKKQATNRLFLEKVFYFAAKMRNCVWVAVGLPAQSDRQILLSANWFDNPLLFRSESCGGARFETRVCCDLLLGVFVFADLSCRGCFL